MAHYGTLRDYRFPGKSIADIRDSNLYGMNDEKLGKIDDVIFDHSTGEIRYVVVDTGGWLKSKRFIVPADRLRVSATHDGDYEVGLTKQQIESFPPFDEDAVEEQNKWRDYEARYQSAWSNIPIEREGQRAVGGVSSRLGPRWSSFEERLREERDVVVGSCSVCTPRKGRKVS